MAFRWSVVFPPSEMPFMDSIMSHARRGEEELLPGMEETMHVPAELAPSATPSEPGGISNWCCTADMAVNFMISSGHGLQLVVLQLKTRVLALSDYNNHTCIIYVYENNAMEVLVYNRITTCLSCARVSTHRKNRKSREKGAYQVERPSYLPK